MIRILILIMFGALAVSLAYFTFHSIPLIKKIVVVGGGLFAAVVATSLQANNPIYMPILALVGVALAISLVYMKLLERQQSQQLLQAEERKARLAAASNKIGAAAESAEKSKGDRNFG